MPHMLALLRRSSLVPELGHFDVEVAEAGAHDAANGAHGHEDGHVPQIVEHTGAVKRQAVRVQPEVTVSPEVGLEDLPRVLLKAIAEQGQCLSSLGEPGRQ